MVVEQVHVARVLAIETEDDAPVAGYGHGPESGEVALQRMQPKARQRHVVRYRSLVQTGENTLDLVGLIRPDLAAVSRFEQQAQPFMSEAANHSEKCNLSPPIREGRLRLAREVLLRLESARACLEPRYSLCLPLKRELRVRYTGTAAAALGHGAETR